MLYDHDILVWGGDVRDQEAWSGRLIFMIPVMLSHSLSTPYQLLKSFKPQHIRSLLSWRFNLDVISPPIPRG
jgi:hypothetical protein